MSEEKKKTGAEVVAEIHDRIAKVEAYQQQLEAAKARGLGMNGEPAREFRLSAAFYGKCTGDWKGREFERDEMVRGAELQRDLGFGTGDGANIVPPEYQNQIIDRMRATSVAIESGATVLNLTGGQPLQVPRLTTSLVAAYKAEHVAGDASDLGIDQVTASPKTLMAATAYSRELMRLSDPSIEAVVRDDISKMFSRAVDLYAFEGDGIAPNPAGIATFAPDLGALGAVLDFDALTTMIEALDTANAEQENRGFAMHPRDFWNAARTKDSTGQYLLQPAVSQGLPATFWGIPVRTSSQLSITQTATDSTAYLAAWAALWVVFWGGLEVQATMEGEDYWLKNQMGVRGILMNDIAARHDEAFVQVSGVAAS